MTMSGCVRSRIRLASALAISLLVSAGCRSEKAPAQTKGQAGPPPAVIVAEVTRRSVPVYGEYVAQTVANAAADVQARVEASRAPRVWYRITWI